MTLTRTSAENYDLDHAIALSRGVTVDDIDALPLAIVETLREAIATRQGR